MTSASGWLTSCAKAPWARLQLTAFVARHGWHYAEHGSCFTLLGVHSLTN
ncbi:hypothetical protein GSU75_04538 [Pseudomonas savastanoi pv. phaseolicola]|nr:hypothetical protein [Pseudomonas savastanoi pv. phaseolicola]